MNLKDQYELALTKRESATALKVIRPMRQREILSSYYRRMLSVSAVYKPLHQKISGTVCVKASVSGTPLPRLRRIGNGGSLYGIFL